MATSAGKKASPQRGRGHNSRSRLQTLEKRAKEQQIAAQKAWTNLMSAQLEQDVAWGRVLASATMTGIRPESLRKQFDVSPSTFSRWASGLSSPSQSLRTRLGQEMMQLAEESKESVFLLDGDSESTE